MRKIIGLTLTLLMTSGIVAADWSYSLDTTGTGYLYQDLWVSETDYSVYEYVEVDDGDWDLYVGGGGDDTDFSLYRDLDATGDYIDTDMGFYTATEDFWTYMGAEDDASIGVGVYTWRDTTAGNQGMIVYGPGPLSSAGIDGDYIWMGTGAEDSDEDIYAYGYAHDVDGATGFMGAGIVHDLATDDLSGYVGVAVFI